MRPSFLQIEVSGECNLRCPMCAISCREKRAPGRAAMMDFGLFRRIIDGCGGASRAHLQGIGEPLLHPRIIEMIAYAAGKGIRVTLSTNLTPMTQAMAARCVAGGLSDMYVSVDAATPRAYESIRVNARFSRLTKCLALVRKAREQARSASPRLLFVAVLMRRNLRELPGIIRLAADSGAAAVCVQHLFHQRDRRLRAFYERETLMNEDRSLIAREFRRARAVAAGRKIELHLPKTGPRRAADGEIIPEKCGWPMAGAYITWRGDVMPCCMIATAEQLHFGNMGAQRIEEIWESRRYRAFCARLASRRPPVPCRSCPLYRGVF